MSYLLKRQRRLRLLRAARGHFSGLLQPFGDLQAHSPLRPLHKPASYHPDIGQRKQRDELRSVFLEPAIAHLGMSELTLDDSKRMLHLGPDTGLEFLGFFSELATRRVLLLSALARAHVHVPIHARGLRSFAGTKIARIGKHHVLLSGQQAVSLSHIVDIGSSADDGVHQDRLCVHANVRLHSKVPLVALLGLVHLRVTLTGTVLGGARCRNQSGVHHRAGLEQQALGGQLGVDHLQYLRAQLVLFEQMAKSQDVDAVGNTLGAADAHKVTVEVGLEQNIFGPQVRQSKPLLQAMNAQHHCQIKGRTSRLGHRCVRCDQCQQLAPRHDLLHLIEQDLLARASQVEIKVKVYLFHAINTCNLRAPDPTGWGRVLDMIPSSF